MKRGWSLVELLVVVAILGVLAALIQPVLLRAQAASKRGVCASQLRSIGVATMVYTHDHDDWLPAAIDNHKWMGRDTIWWLVPGVRRITDVLDPYVTNPRLFCCPSDFGDPEIGVVPSRFLVSGSSYYYPYLHTGYPMAAIQDPSRTTVFTDQKGTWHTQPDLPFPRWMQNHLLADGRVAFGHSGFETLPSWKGQ